MIAEAPLPGHGQLSMALARVTVSFRGVADQSVIDLDAIGWPKPWRNPISECFPQHGLRAVANPQRHNTTPDKGDAIDDGVDIVEDLSVTIAIASIVGSDEAARHLQLMVGHWLKYLRPLNHLLHDL